MFYWHLDDIEANRKELELAMRRRALTESQGCEGAPTVDRFVK
jgi:hypothetical protein